MHFHTQAEESLYFLLKLSSMSAYFLLVSASFLLFNNESVFLPFIPTFFLRE